MTGRTPTLTPRFSRLRLRKAGAAFTFVFIVIGAASLSSAAFAECPDLQPYYPAGDEAWSEVVQQLTPLMPECLQSAEYFALLGAAQMNSGQLTPAMESLERALLIDPDHGAATIDYAQTLYLSGQLFPALEINAGLLQRSDLPQDIATRLLERQQQWQAQTTDKGFTAEAAAGYDDNLNGGLASREFTLTLTGGPVLLPVSPEFQPVSGAYLNLRLSGFYRKQTPDRTHDLVYALRNRRSHHKPSELLQFDWRYAQTLSLRNYQWELAAGTSHLYYGGSPLYTVAEARTRLNREGTGCRPQYELTTQHQSYHGQSFMRGLEASVTAGMYCELESSAQAMGFDVGPLVNHALDDTRPGADRDGWRLRLYWQMRLGLGTVSSQFNYAQLGDEEGYNELLSNGASREIYNRSLRIQYSRPLMTDLTLMINLNHQRQGSNLAPFENDGTGFDIGLSLNF
jgi:tetratricopeptide (TPR) repeat protein